jgi:hypothetical protein
MSAITLRSREMSLRDATVALGQLQNFGAVLVALNDRAAVLEIVCRYDARRVLRQLSAQAPQFPFVDVTEPRAIGRPKKASVDDFLR